MNLLKQLVEMSTLRDEVYQLWHAAYTAFEGEHAAGVRQMGGEDDSPIDKMNAETLADYMFTMVDENDFKRIYSVPTYDHGPKGDQALADATAFAKEMLT